MKSNFFGNIQILALAFIFPPALLAQAPTSRTIPFTVNTTLIPGSTAQQVNVVIFDAATAGTTITSELQTVDVDAGGNISFLFGSQTAGGLDPLNFPSGSSRFLDVLDATTASLLAARIPLNATTFALSPGPEGPVGPAGPQGPQGPPGNGTVNSVDSGAGLLGGPITSSGTLSLDAGFLNARYPQLATPNTFASNQSVNGSLTVSNAGGGGSAISTTSVLTALQVANFGTGAGLFVSNGGAVFAGNGTNLRIGDPGCGPNFAGLGLFGSSANCTNFALLADTLGHTYVNSSATNGAIHFRHSNIEAMTIVPNGNVGIGANPPQAKLDVAGRVKSQNLRAQVAATDSVSAVAACSNGAFCDLPGMSLTVQTQLPVLILANIGGIRGSACHNMLFDLVIDGVAVSRAGTQWGNSGTDSGGNSNSIKGSTSLMSLQSLTPGNHGIKIRYTDITTGCLGFSFITTVSADGESRTLVVMEM